MEAFFGDEKLRQATIEKVEDRLSQSSSKTKIPLIFPFEELDVSDFEDYNPCAFEEKLGISDWLINVATELFRGITYFQSQSASDAREFAINFYESIPLGVDVEKVRIPFLRFILDDVMEVVARLDIEEDFKQEIIDANREVYDALDKDKKTIEKATNEAYRLCKRTLFVECATSAAYYAAACFAAFTINAALNDNDKIDVETASHVSAYANATIPENTNYTYALNIETQKATAKHYADKLLEMLSELKVD